MSTPRFSGTQFATAYVVAVFTLGVLDAAWLGWLATDFYRKAFGSLLADSVRLLPAALFYLLYPLGLVFLALRHAPTTFAAAMTSAVVGLVAYGTYDLTNWSTLREWGPLLTVVDLAWGTFASSLAGAIAHRAAGGRLRDQGQS